MHTHIILNSDINLKLVIFSEEEEIDIVDAIDEIITNEICHAEEGISQT
jgi:anti-sigma regulatory factor (Ser/Thr protein kinase)